MTLIECLVYLALLTLLITSSHASMLALADAAGRIRQEAMLLREGMFLEGLIRDAVRESTGVAGTGTDILLLEEAEFERTAGALRYEADGSSLWAVAPEVEVRAFSSQAYAPPAGPARLEVQVELTVSGDAGTELVRRFAYLFYL